MLRRPEYIYWHLLIGTFLLCFVCTSYAEVFVVDSDEDLSICDETKCTLRGAIEAVNASTDPAECNTEEVSETCHLIQFDLDVTSPGAAGAAIMPMQQLPALERPVTIDGYSPQMQARGITPNTNAADSGLGLNTALGIELRGFSVPGAARGLVLDVGSEESIIRGLAIGGFSFIGIEIKNFGLNRIEGNFIGTSLSGASKFANGNGITVLGSAENIIGGTNPAARNLISGNTDEGIDLLNADSNNNRIEGNLIGTDISGLAGLGNKNGILVSAVTGSDNYANNNTIGGDQPASRNVISGNVTGISIFRGHDNRVRGNWIGIDVTGGEALANAAYGVDLVEASGNIIGTEETGIAEYEGAANVISGNVFGLGISAGFGDEFGPSLNANNNIVAGNYIGTSPSGSEAIPNVFFGVYLASNDEGEATVSGNRIGSEYGDAQLGGGNLIAGNGQIGLVLSGAETTENRVQNNGIGGHFSLRICLGNESHGILVAGANNNHIGGDVVDPDYVFQFTGKSNDITCNGGGRGVWPWNPATMSFNGIGAGLNGHGVVIVSGTGNSIRGNEIENNEGRGIDLGNDSFDINDLSVVEIGSPPEKLIFHDEDDGPNNRQNYPVLLSIDLSRTDEGLVTETWMLNSKPETQYVLDFYDGEDPSGFGEGSSISDDSIVGTTNYLGKLIVEYEHSWVNSASTKTTATATEIVGGIARSTSEFSMLDRDADALADAWECPLLFQEGTDRRTGEDLNQQGIDINEDGVIDYDLRQFQNESSVCSADEHLTKNIYVEYDGMEDPNPGPGPSLEDFLDCFDDDICGFPGPVLPPELAACADKSPFRNSTWLPSDFAICAVENAFADVPAELVNNPSQESGITLRLIDGGDRIPPNRWIVDENDEFEVLRVIRDTFCATNGGYSLGCFGTPEERTSSNWKHIKAAKELVFHYYFAADEVFERNTPFEQGEFAGAGEVGDGMGGNDFFSAIGPPPPVSDAWESWLYSINQAGTIMHELGHNLGMGHGGRKVFDSDTDLSLIENEIQSDDVEDKPNYHSVMNYIWVDYEQWMLEDNDGDEEITPPEQDKDGSTKPDGTPKPEVVWKLDYSRHAFEPLFEISLNESDGIGPHPGPGEHVSWVPKGPRPPPGLNGTEMALEGGPVNWNGNASSADPDVTELCINNIDPKKQDCDEIEVLEGREDWSNLRFYFLESPGFIGRRGITTLRKKTRADKIAYASIGLTPGIFEIVYPQETVVESEGSVTVYVARAAGTRGAVSVDFEALAGTAEKGSDFGATTGTLNFAEGDYLKSFEVPVVSDGVDEPDESFEVVLSNPTGGARLLATSPSEAAITIVDDDGPGVIQFAESYFEVNETGGQAVIEVIRELGSDGPVSIDYFTTNDTAVAGEDYISTSGTLNLAAGQTSASFAVPVLHDLTTEPTELVSLRLINPAGGVVLGNRNLVPLSILDEPVNSGVLEFSAANYDVIEDQGTATITVTRSISTEGVVSVDYSTSNDTATAGSDYNATSNTLNFEDGVSEQSFTVPITNDGAVEGLESLDLTLSNPTGGSGIGPQGQAQLHIIDDDSDGALQFASEIFQVSEGDAVATIEVVRLGDTSTVATVDYLASNGTALLDEDYSATSGELSFGVGVTSAIFEVPIVDDDDAELLEDVILSLGNFGGAEEGSTTVALLEIEDDDRNLVVTTTSDDGVGSLRWAISRANDDPERDLITFNIPGSGVRSIRPRRPLPRILTPVIIDGYSQPGSRPNSAPHSTNATLNIYLDGALAETVENVTDDGGTYDAFPNGFRLLGVTDSIIRGIVFGRWSQAGIRVEDGSDNVVITGNFFGTDPTGTVSYGQGRGVSIASATNTIVGGKSPSERNLISGNGVGVHIGGGGFCLAQIGTPCSPAAANDNQVLGNLIGVAADGASPLGNGVGVKNARTFISDNNVMHEGNVVGGVAPGEANIIAFNGTGVSDESGASIRGNSFYENGVLIPSLGTTDRWGKAIDSDSAINQRRIANFSFNDADESDGIQNFPILSAVGVSGGSTMVTGRLNSTPDSSFEIDVYVSPELDVTGFGEGRDYLGAETVVTGSGGDAAFTFIYPAELFEGLSITATATNDSGVTSEFSARILVGDTPASPLVVNTTDDTDDGSCNAEHCSLREAILDAGNIDGPATIEFGIDSGAQSISPLVPYPPLGSNITIDGTSQPGYAGVPLIQLPGGYDPDSDDDPDTRVGLRLFGGSNTIRGLLISGFQDAGILMEGPGGNVIAGNFIGTDANGGIAEPADTVPTGNNIGIHIKSTGDTIGGTNPEDRNIISGNFAGIWIDDEASGTVIKGNTIGLDASGTSPLFLIPPAPIDIPIIDIESFSGGLPGIRIQGATGITIGGTEAGAGNVISGNPGLGIFIWNNQTNNSEIVIQGNRIGTSADGTQPIGNGFYGIYALARGVTIGGSQSGAGNLIAGNGMMGIVAPAAFGGYTPLPGVTIQGNFIGTDITGTQDLGHGLDGIVLQGDNHVVGGATTGAGNLISGNDRAGILYIRSTRSLDGGSGTTMRGNRIGTTADGAGRLGNGSGILIGGGATEPFGMDPQNPGTPQGPVRGTIGGTAAGEGNTIAYNGGPGIAMIGEEIRILGNSIYENSGMGIDLGNDGVTENDAGDTDTGILDPDAPFFPPGAPIPPQFLIGANQAQNFPVITSATLSGGTINVSGTLNSIGNRQYRLEFFANAAADASGNGEGRRFLGFLNATTNPAGDATFSQGFATQPGQFITATATDPDGNSSEFSVAVAISGASNTAPVAVDDVAVTLEMTSVDIDVPVNDSDPDGDVDLTTVVVTSDPSKGATSVNAATGVVTYTPTPGELGADSFQYTIDDTAGATSNTATVNITINPLPNQPPVADAGDDQQVVTGETATLDGSGSGDPDGGSLSYAWSIIDRPDGSVASLVGAGTVGPTFTPDVRGSYTIQLIVNDGEDDSSPDTVVIEYLNTAPVADAGADIDLTAGEVAMLDGSGSSDFDGDDLNFRWAIVGAPPGSDVVLSDVNSPTPNFTPDRPGLYIINLIVDDGFEYSTTVSVLINAESDNTAPVAHAGPDQQARLSDTVTLDGSASSDVDEDELNYLWSFNTRPPGSSATLSDDTAEMPTFVADAKGTFELELVVNDGTEDSDPDTVTIDIDLRPRTAPDLTPETDTGASDSDDQTFETQPDFFVKCSAAGNTITLYTDNPAADTPIGTLECTSTGVETANVDTPLELGVNSITYTDQDEDEESGHSPALTITVVNDDIFFDGFEPFVNGNVSAR